MDGSKYRSAGSGIPESKRVQAPLAPGFYRSCAAALTDGFRPQSGPVQRGVFEAAFGGRENRTTGLRPWKCTPFGANAPLPPEGEVFLPLIFCFHKKLKD